MGKRIRSRDTHGNPLRKGETQRQDRRYVYQYTDEFGKRHTLYGKTLQELRDKEDAIALDKKQGIKSYVAGTLKVNGLVERYLKTKVNLLNTTKANYEYDYEHFIRPEFGTLRVGNVKYSNVKKFYFDLVTEKKLSPSTVDKVNNLLHPAFQMAVRDDIIRKNPTDGVMMEVYKAYGGKRSSRHALTIEQQRAFLEFVKNDLWYSRYYNMFIVLFGTGMRIGELAGLCWGDIDFESNNIRIERSVVYVTRGEETGFSLHKPKTAAGIRTIPMLPQVREALMDEFQVQDKTGYNHTELDGVSGFVFKNKNGGLIGGHALNSKINYMVALHNSEEEVKAEKEDRKPVIIPNFSCHVVRHTFATHLCETETNLKTIQSIMGHADIQTTMNIYAEATERKKQDAIGKIDGQEYFF